MTVDNLFSCDVKPVLFLVLLLGVSKIAAGFLGNGLSLLSIADIIAPPSLVSASIALIVASLVISLDCSSSAVMSETGLVFFLPGRGWFVRVVVSGHGLF